MLKNVSIFSALTYKSEINSVLENKNIEFDEWINVVMRVEHKC